MIYENELICSFIINIGSFYLIIEDFPAGLSDMSCMLYALIGMKECSKFKIRIRMCFIFDELVLCLVI